MIKTLILDKSTNTFTKTDDIANIRKSCESENSIVWVDVSDPHDKRFQQLAKELGFHPLAVEDCKKGHQRPKIDEYQGYYFIVFYEINTDDEGYPELRELSLFVSKKYVVTVHNGKLRTVTTAMRLWKEWSQEQGGTGLLTYLLLDPVVDEYLPTLDKFSDRLDDLETEIFENFRPESLQEILLIKKQLLFLRKAAAPLRDVLNSMLRREQPIFQRETLFYFQDVFDHLIRIVDSIDTLREVAGSTMDAYLSISGNRTNFVMKRLTSISAILMSVTLIAGIYGMNFQFMPELGWRYGYVGSLGSMLLVAMALYFYFRRIKWL